MCFLFFLCDACDCLLLFACLWVCLLLVDCGSLYIVRCLLTCVLCLCFAFFVVCCVLGRGVLLVELRGVS